MLTPTVYGYADHDEIDDAITTRVQSIDATKVIDVSEMLGEALAVIAEINQSIPVHSKHRHLVANALEKFANG